MLFVRGCRSLPPLCRDIAKQSATLAVLGLGSVVGQLATKKERERHPEVAASIVKGTVLHFAIGEDLGVRTTCVGRAR